MKNLSSNFVRILFCFSLLFLLKTDIQAQTANCDGPGNFNIEVNATQGTGTAEDPYVVCQEEAICFTSEGVSQTLDMANPGLVFALYSGLPTDPDPNSDLNYQSTAFSDENQEPVINEGCGFFTNLGGTADSITVCIVPVVVPDIDAVILNPEADCAGVDLSLGYTCITFVNEDVFANCEIPTGNPDCFTSTFVADETEMLCSDDTPTLPVLDLEVILEGDTETLTGTVEWYTGTNPEEDNVYTPEAIAQDGCDPLEERTVYAFAQCNTGNDLSWVQVASHTFQVFPQLFAPTLSGPDLTEEGECCYTIDPACPNDELNIEEFCIASGDDAGEIEVEVSSANCASISFDLAYEACETTVDCADFSADLVEGDCSPFTNSPTYILIVSGGSEEYTVSGATEGEFVADDFPIDFPVDNEVDFEITVEDTEGCSITIEATSSNCDITEPCEAGAGDIEFADFYCAGDVIALTADGANLDAAYTQLFVLTDTSLNIIAINTSGEFTEVGGTYLGHALNVLTSEVDGVDLADLIGLNAADVLAGLECFDISTSTNLVVLNPIETSIESECADNTGVVSVTFTFTGGLPEYALENGYPDVEGFFYTVGGLIEAELSPEDEFSTEVVENEVYELVISDFLECTTVLNDTFPNCVKDCEAEVGLFELTTTDFCTGETVIATAVDFQEGADYQQWYLLTDQDLITVEANMTGEFEVNNPGNYTIYVYNIEGEFEETDFLGANGAILMYNCYDLSATEMFMVQNCALDPIEIDDVVYNVDTLLNSYNVSFEIMGGTGVYTVNSGTVDSTTFVSDEIMCGSNLLVSVTDDEGNALAVELDAPCEDLGIPADFNCDDYPIEISVDYFCNDELGIYTITYGFTGGLPQYAAENGSNNPNDYFYTASGNLSGQFTIEENNHVTEHADTEPYSLSLVDNAGCTADTTNTPPSCVKTAVELIEFKGKPLVAGNQLNWSTATEQKSASFIIERSYDEVNFTSIGQLFAAGESYTIKSYDILDNGVTAKIAYYRLISVDLDGNQAMSNVITVIRGDDIGGFGILGIGPNPTKGELTLSIQYENIKDFSIHITDVTGKDVDSGGDRTQVVNDREGIYELQLNVADYPSGLYFVKVTDGTNTDVIKFIKKD